MFGFNLLATLFRQEKESPQPMQRDLSIREKYYEFGRRVREKIYEVHSFADYERKVKKIESDIGLNLTPEKIEIVHRWFKDVEYSRFRARLAQSLIIHRKMQERKAFTRREARQSRRWKSFRQLAHCVNADGAKHRHIRSMWRTPVGRSGA